MTPKLSAKSERISLGDISLAQRALDTYWRIPRRRTYAFNITSDMLTDSEETQS